MPIRPENAHHYRTPEWHEANRLVRERAGNRCECMGECGDEHPQRQNGGRCDAPNSEWIARREDALAWWELNDEIGTSFPYEGWSKPIRVVLTVAHLDQDPSVHDTERMRLLCQRCHNLLDAPHRARNAARTRRQRGGQTTLPGVTP